MYPTAAAAQLPIWVQNHKSAWQSETKSVDLLLFVNIVDIWKPSQEYLHPLPTSNTHTECMMLFCIPHFVQADLQMCLSTEVIVEHRIRLRRQKDLNASTSL